jgi:hypothetical protein
MISFIHLWSSCSHIHIELLVPFPKTKSNFSAGGVDSLPSKLISCCTVSSSCTQRPSPPLMLCFWHFLVHCFLTCAALRITWGVLNNPNSQVQLLSSWVRISSRQDSTSPFPSSQVFAVSRWGWRPPQLKCPLVSQLAWTQPIPSSLTLKFLLHEAHSLYLSACLALNYIYLCECPSLPLDQGSANIFWKGPDSKYVRHYSEMEDLRVGILGSCLRKPKNELHGQWEGVKQESLLR